MVRVSINGVPVHHQSIRVDQTLELQIPSGDVKVEFISKSQVLSRSFHAATGEFIPVEYAD